MRFLFSVLSLVLLTTACSQSDREMRQRIPGTWVPDFNPDFAWRVEGSGHFCKLYKGGKQPEGWTAEGTWQLTKRRLVFTTTNAPREDYGLVEDFRIVRIDEHEMIVLDGDIQTRIRRK
jgi:hypothetical protein